MTTPRMSFGLYNRYHYERDRSIKLKMHFGGKCVLCGYDKNFACLDFHHRNPAEKSFLVNAKTKCTWEAKIAEANKCMLLCKNCHIAIHFTKMSKESWLERVEIRKTIMDTHPPYMRGLNRRKKKVGKTPRKKKSVQSSPSVKVAPTIIFHRPEPAKRDAFALLRDTLPDLIIESAAEINHPSYVRPPWMTDSLFENINAAAIDQISKYRGFDPVGLFGSYPTYPQQGATL